MKRKDHFRHSAAVFVYDQTIYGIAYFIFHDSAAFFKLPFDFLFLRLRKTDDNKMPVPMLLEGAFPKTAKNSFSSLADEVRPEKMIAGRRKCDPAV